MELRCAFEVHAGSGIRYDRRWRAWTSPASNLAWRHRASGERCWDSDADRMNEPLPAGTDGVDRGGHVAGLVMDVGRAS